MYFLAKAFNTEVSEWFIHQRAIDKFAPNFAKDLVKVAELKLSQK
jgi:hypothetical protein